MSRRCGHWIQRAVGAILLGFVMVTGAVAEPRPPKVAGAFYPEERTELLELVHELLDRSRSRRPPAHLASSSSRMPATSTPG